MMELFDGLFANLIVVMDFILITLIFKAEFFANLLNILLT
jgi:hypothetical protein